jgi:hypothetical protein
VSYPLFIHELLPFHGYFAPLANFLHKLMPFHGYFASQQMMMEEAHGN